MFQQSLPPFTPNISKTAYFPSLGLPTTPVFPIDKNLSPIKNISDTKDRSDIKARNRIAAKKWRTKKDNYLIELENENDSLRSETLDLIYKQHAIKVENAILEKELEFFQTFISKIINQQDLPPS